MKHALPFLLCVAFANPVLAANGDWEVAAQSNGIVVHTRLVDGSSLREFKAQTVIPAPVADVVEVFQDVTTYPSWMHRCVESRSIEQDDAAGTGYVRLDFPFPVSDRDAVVTMTRIGDSPDAFVFEGKPVPDRVPEVSGVVRIREMKIRWEFRAREDGGTDVAYRQHANPGGYVPTAFLNRTVVDQPLHTLAGLARVVAQRAR